MVVNFYLKSSFRSFDTVDFGIWRGYLDHLLQFFAFLPETANKTGRDDGFRMEMSIGYSLLSLSPVLNVHLDRGWHFCLFI